MGSLASLCGIPAGVSPNGVYNFVNPPSLAHAVLGVGISLAIVSTTFVVGRVFVNRTKMRLSDHFTYIGCLFNIAFTGIIIAQRRYYRHTWDIPICWFNTEYVKLPFVQTTLWVPAFFFPKAAIFLLYRQLFATSRRFRIMIDVGMLVTLLLYLSQIPLAAIYAAPRAGDSWDDFLFKLKDNAKPFALGGTIQSAVSTALDLYIFFLPLPILVKLRMPASRKWQLIGVFSTALLGVAASVVSLVFKVKILTSDDSIWLGAITSIASLVETNVALIVGCMPACAQLVKVYVGESAFYQYLRSHVLSKLSGGTGACSKQNKSDEAHVATFGSPQAPGWKREQQQYLELTDSQLFESKTGTTVTEGRDEVWEGGNNRSGYGGNNPHGPGRMV